VAVEFVVLVGWRGYESQCQLAFPRGGFAAIGQPETEADAIRIGGRCASQPTRKRRGLPGYKITIEGEQLLLRDRGYGATVAGDIRIGEIEKP